MDLFDDHVSDAPLAQRMRPTTLAEVVGQTHLLGEGRILQSLIAQRALRSLILWGPPGTGKTTLAQLYAEAVGARFHPLSAVMSGVKQVREAVEAARLRSLADGRRTALFIDEIHRFNKGQQDALLPFVESGTITLIGATTENPSFEVNGALRSRCKILTLHALDDEDIASLVQRALTDASRGLGPTGPTIDDAALQALISTAAGDARSALNTLEIAADLATAQAPTGTRGTITTSEIDEAHQTRSVRYDKAGDGHYQLASAFIKSMRGSDPDAALFYAVRMLEGGESPEFILRRMIIFASEDIGNADPRALGVAVSAFDAVRLVGLPEGVLAISQAITYLATAPKSNATFMAYGLARKDVLEHPEVAVPKHLVNASTAMMKAAGYGRGYKYPHNFEGNYVAQQHLPTRLKGHRYYQPKGHGYEKIIRERLAQWRGEGS